MSAPDAERDFARLVEMAAEAKEEAELTATKAQARLWDVWVASEKTLSLRQVHDLIAEARAARTRNPS